MLKCICFLQDPRLINTKQKSLLGNDPEY
jgi:hypothetical protein